VSARPSRIVGEDTCVAGGPAGRQLGSVEQRGQHDCGADRLNEFRNLVAVGEVFAHERHEGELGDVYEFDGAARNFHCLPPLDVRVECAAEVVLVDLVCVERPSVVLVLADVTPIGRRCWAAGRPFRGGD
jgi:hypothetical protein